MITSLATPRSLRLAAFAAGAVALAAGAVVVTASAAGFSLGFNGASRASGTASLASVPAKTGSATAVCNDFETHFATNLGTTPSKVDAAFQQALAQTLADEVANKSLTQTQADAIKQKLAAKPPCALASGVGKAPTVNIAKYAQQLMAAAASALGVTPQQLKSDLASGMSLSQIAAAQKPAVTEAQFRTKLIANLKPLLDQAVASKMLTAAQEQEILSRLQTGPIPFWSKPMGKPAAT